MKKPAIKKNSLVIIKQRAESSESEILSENDDLNGSLNSDNSEAADNGYNSSDHEVEEQVAHGSDYDSNEDYDNNSDGNDDENEEEGDSNDEIEDSSEDENEEEGDSDHENDMSNDDDLLLNGCSNSTDGSEDEVTTTETDENQSKKEASQSKQNTADGGRTKQQIALANVMGSLLSKGNASAEVLSKATNSNDLADAETADSSKKSRKRRRDEALMQIVDKDGKVIKQDPEQQTSETATQAQQEMPSNKRRFPMSRKLDPFCQDPRIETDVVKEKKLRMLATQGVVQLFNTLEQYRKQNLLQDGTDHSSDGRGRRKNKPGEVSAITSGRGGFINFLGKHEAVKGSDRPLFGETKASV